MVKIKKKKKKKKKEEEKEQVKMDPILSNTYRVRKTNPMQVKVVMVSEDQEKKKT
jgi:hypothetical protein